MDAVEKSLKVFVRSDGKVPFVEWIRSLRDSRAEQKVDARLARLRLGNPGDCKPVGEGVCELRINYGPGYRVYYGSDRGTIVVLLMAGDKGTQHEDIKKAKEYWQEYKSKKKHRDY